MPAGFVDYLRGSMGWSSSTTGAIDVPDHLCLEIEDTETTRCSIEDRATTNLTIEDTGC